MSTSSSNPILHNWRSLLNILSSLALILLEVLQEELAKLLNLSLEALGTSSPGVLGVEQLRGHTGAGLGHLEVEDLIGLVLDLGQLSRVDGVEDGTRVLERAALASLGEAGADPTGVEQPGVGVMLLDLVGEHLGIAHGVKGQEGLSEAGREGRLRLENTVLSAGHLGGVARDEVEHGLCAVELGDWGQDATGIAGEEDDVLGVAIADAGDLGVVDVLNGVGAASVLSEGSVIVVDLAGDGVEDDVLEDRTEADGVENIGLLLGRETNALGIAAALDVEDAAVAPAVLVVADQSAVGVGRQSGFTSTGQTEEQSDVAVLALVGRGVQGQDVVLDGALVEHDGEDALLHLTGVLGAKDDHLLLGEVDGDGG